MTAILVALLSSPSALAAKDATFWMPPQASTIAADVDFVFYYIYWLCVFFFIVMMGATFGFAWKYRERSKDQRTDPISHSTRLEIAWSAFPSLLLVVMFVLGFRGFINLSVPPADSFDVRVVGTKWSWAYEYPGTSITTDTLVVPANTPVRLTMNSRDVLHSFFVPDFRIKKDVIPNRYSVIWFEATAVGEHIVYCTEYCGNGHSRMMSKVQVMEPNAFNVWLQESNVDLDSMPLTDLGEMTFKTKGCNACHSVDGSALVGPTLKGKYGIEEPMEDGSTVTVDDNYIRESIMAPTAKVVAGFAPTMPPYQGQLEDREVDGLIEYIKSLK